MDIRIDQLEPGQLPLEGWHTAPHNRLAFCLSQGDLYLTQTFPPGMPDLRDEEEVDRFEKMARRIAWACFAEVGAPGPSSPKGLERPRSQTPPQSGKLV